MAEIAIRVRPWTRDHETKEGEEVGILFCDVISVDGIELAERQAPTPARTRISFDSGDFVELEIEDPPAELRARYTEPASFLMGTDESRLRLPVTKLVVTDA
jgi:hypothetical protein